MAAFGSLPTAVETNTRSPHTIGLDTATPATGVVHRMFSPVLAFHLIAVAAPSPTPDAFAPRNDGQFCADTVAEAIAVASTMANVRITFLSASRRLFRGVQPRRRVSFASRLRAHSITRRPECRRAPA